MLKLASGEPSTLRAWLNRVSRTLWQAALTAVPAEAAAQEPPSTGDFGSEKSPILTVTSSIGTPSSSAAICAMMV